MDWWIQKLFLLMWLAPQMLLLWVGLFYVSVALWNEIRKL